jgi:hypothetical protein
MIEKESAAARWQRLGELHVALLGRFVGGFVLFLLNQAAFDELGYAVLFWLGFGIFFVWAPVFLIAWWRLFSFRCPRYARAGSFRSGTSASSGCSA